MNRYTGNAIYDYIKEKKLNYYFTAEKRWLLVYGDHLSMPKFIACVFEVAKLDGVLSCEEQMFLEQAKVIAQNFNLPFILICFSEKDASTVMVSHPQSKILEKMSYADLKELYSNYGIGTKGTVAKPINEYDSGKYHVWQRRNLGNITVTDFDLMKLEGNVVKEIVELKRSKIELSKWKPFPQDNPNFALIINTIISSEREIPFKIYYNKMFEGEIGKRQEEISEIKVFEFNIPNEMLSSEVSYHEKGIFEIQELLE